MALTDAWSARRLLDLEEIRVMKARYGVLVDGLVAKPGDAGALDELVDLFTPDAEFHFGGRIGSFCGESGIRNFYGETLPNDRQWTWHSFHSPWIDINGDDAMGSWTIYALAVSRNAKPGPPQAIYGRYQDKYIRTQSGWRQAKLTFVDESRPFY